MARDGGPWVTGMPQHVGRCPLQGRCSTNICRVGHNYQYLNIQILQKIPHEQKYSKLAALLRWGFRREINDELTFLSAARILALDMYHLWKNGEDSQISVL